MRILRSLEATLGFFLALLIVIPFLRIRTSNNYSESLRYNFIELSPSHQFFIVNILLLLLCFWFFLSFKKSKIPGISGETLLVLFWVLACILSAAFGADPHTSLKRILITFAPSFLVYYLAISCSSSRETFKGFVAGFSFVTLVCVFYAFAGFVAEILIDAPKAPHATIYIFGREFSQSLGQRHFTFNEHLIELQRFSGFYPNPNGLGISSAICLILLLEIKKDTPTLYAFLSAAMLFGLALSGSRMSFLLLASSGLYLLSCSWTGTKKTLILTTLGLLTIALVLLTASQTFEGAMELLGTGPQEFLSLGERSQTFSVALEVASNHWLLGNGFGIGAEVVFGEESDTNAVHSVILNALVETGIVGSFALLCVWGYPIFSRRTTPDRDASGGENFSIINAVLVGMFIASMFDLSISRFHYINLVFFFLLGVSAAFRQHDEQVIES